MRVRYTSHVSDIGQQAWAGLRGDTLICEYDWLQLWESVQEKQRKIGYWWLEDELGVVAAAVAFLRPAGPAVQSVDQHRFGPWAGLIRGVREALVPDRPTLVVGAQIDPGKPVLLRAGLEVKKARNACRILLDKLESDCTEADMGLVIRAVFDSEQSLLAELEARRYLPSVSLPQSVLDVQWDSWAGYLKFLKQHHPATEKSVRMQVNRGRRSGVIIEPLDDPRSREEEIHEILSDHFQRKNGSPYLAPPQYPALLKSRFGDRATVLIARLDQRLIGVSLLLRYGVTTQWLNFGIAADQARSRSAVYFNLAFHTAIKQATLDGSRRLVLGTMAYQPKCARGARLVPMSNWHWQPRAWIGGLQRLGFAFEARRQAQYLKQFQSPGSQRGKGQ